MGELPTKFIAVLTAKAVAILLESVANGAIRQVRCQQLAEGIN
jgi:hypothetical protein